MAVSTAMSFNIYIKQPELNICTRHSFGFVLQVAARLCEVMRVNPRRARSNCKKKSQAVAHVDDDDVEFVSELRADTHASQNKGGTIVCIFTACMQTMGIYGPPHSRESASSVISGNVEASQDPAMIEEMRSLVGRELGKVEGEDAQHYTETLFYVHAANNGACVYKMRYVAKVAQEWSWKNATPQERQRNLDLLTNSQGQPELPSGESSLADSQLDSADVLGEDRGLNAN